MSLAFVVTAAGPLLGAAGWFLYVPFIFWL